MQLSSELMAWLPSLRRYARALTGSQDAGDDLVVRALERLSIGPRLADDIAPKIGLYKVVSDVWNSVIGKHIMDMAAKGSLAAAADERIGQLEGIPRQAFLLVAMEKLTPTEAAIVLSLSEHEFKSELAKARHDVASQVATDVLVIEDELFIAADLEKILTDLGHNVGPVARTHSQAVAVARRQKPGLIVSDIQLADDSSGIDAVRDILEFSSAPIIFVTSYPELLLTGTRPEPIFLIKKPFSSDEVRGVVSQALFFRQNARASDIAEGAVRLSGQRSH